MTTEQKRKEVEEALMAIPAGEHFGVKRISEHVHACFFTVRDILQEHPLVRKVEGFKRWVRLPVEGETVHPAIPQRANPKIGPVARKILDWMAELPDGSSLTVGRVVEKFDTTEHTATRTIRMAKGWTLANPVRAVTESGVYVKGDLTSWRASEVVRRPPRSYDRKGFIEPQKVCGKPEQRTSPLFPRDIHYRVLQKISQEALTVEEIARRLDIGQSDDLPQVVVRVESELEDLMWQGIAEKVGDRYQRIRARRMIA